MRLDSLDTYLVEMPSALVLEDGDERMLIRYGDGSLDSLKKAISKLRTALDELSEVVDPYQVYLAEQESPTERAAGA